MDVFLFEKKVCFIIIKIHECTNLIIKFAFTINAVIVPCSLGYCEDILNIHYQRCDCSMFPGLL